MVLHRKLGILQKSAWHLAHRVRDLFAIGSERMAVPGEVDEDYFGGCTTNKLADKKIENATGTVGKTAVVGRKDRRTNQVQSAAVERRNRETLQAFVNAGKKEGAKVYSEEHVGYICLENQGFVKHSVGE